MRCEMVEPDGEKLTPFLIKKITRTSSRSANTDKILAGMHAIQVIKYFLKYYKALSVKF